MFFNMFEIMEGLFSVVFIIVAVTIAATAVMSLRAAKRQYDNREKSHFEDAAPNSNETKTDKKPAFCPFCGAPLDENDEKCTYCGARIQHKKFYIRLNDSMHKEKFKISLFYF